jgi:dTDP-4-dehydrorhamnose reductase
VLLTGGSGQLARALEVAACGTIPVHRVGRPEFDFDQPEAIQLLLRTLAPAAVVNAAAYTQVDAAEADPDAAARANRDGPRVIAQYCAAARIPLIHISTDYVFDGLKGAPYAETDPTSPTGIYGLTKRDGEVAVLAAYQRAIVLRTSWVYAATGKNFVLTMLNAAKRTDHLRVVADQRGCPTAAPDLAEAILGVLGRIGDGWVDDYAGVFHAAGTGDTTWHGLATALFEDAARHGIPRPAIEPITTADWPTPARRPPDSRLDCEKFEHVFGLRLPHWRARLSKVVGQLCS